MPKRILVADDSELMRQHDTGCIQAESEKASADAFLLKANGGIELLPTIHELLGSYSEPMAA
jgi:hypothetical protein